MLFTDEIHRLVTSRNDEKRLILGHMAEFQRNLYMAFTEQLRELRTAGMADEFSLATTATDATGVLRLTFRLGRDEWVYIPIHNAVSFDEHAPSGDFQNTLTARILAFVNHPDNLPSYSYWINREGHWVGAWLGPIAWGDVTDTVKIADHVQDFIHYNYDGQYSRPYWNPRELIRFADLASASKPPIGFNAYTG